MRASAIAIFASALITTGALAQTQNPPAQSGPGNKAINSSNTNNSNAPVAGANSFTEGQAKSRLESNGFANISALQKDSNGVWRGKGGKGAKDGKTMDVSVDFQGNVNAR